MIVKLGIVAYPRGETLQCDTRDVKPELLNTQAQTA